MTPMDHPTGGLGSFPHLLSTSKQFCAVVFFHLFVFLDIKPLRIKKASVFSSEPSNAGEGLLQDYVRLLGRLNNDCLWVLKNGTVFEGHGELVGVLQFKVYFISEPPVN